MGDGRSDRLDDPITAFRAGTSVCVEALSEGGPSLADLSLPAVPKSGCRGLREALELCDNLRFSRGLAGWPRLFTTNCGTATSCAPRRTARRFFTSIATSPTR